MAVLTLSFPEPPPEVAPLTELWLALPPSPLADHPLDRALVVSWALQHGALLDSSPEAGPGAVRCDATELAARLYPVAPSRRVRTLVAAGHDAAGYRNAQAGEWALACAARRAGAPAAFVERCLADPACALGARYRALGPAQRAQLLERLEAGAAAEVDPAAAGRSRALERAAARVRGRAWPQRSGGSDLAVLEALLGFAATHCEVDPGGGVLVAASTAQIAVQAGVGEETARRAIRRLLGAGHLLEHAPPTEVLARVYLMPPAEEEDPERVDEADGTTPEIAGGGDLGCDAARWSALGKTAVMTLRQLGQRRVSTAELAGELGVSRNTMRARLWRLSQRGLVVAHPDRTWQRTEVDLDVVARSMGTHGARARARMEYHARRRARSALRETPGQIRLPLDAPPRSS